MTPSDLSSADLLDFCSRHQLDSAFRTVVDDHYLPLAKKLPTWRQDSRPLLLGINGGQGTGKSTLADFLRVATRSLFEWNVAVLSIDDFYLTQEERAALAERVHLLFQTRGVPGTHDVEMLGTCIDLLQGAQQHDTILLPRFDKAADDRMPRTHWARVQGPVDLIVLEGWCVASRSQSDDELSEPVNDLERFEDPDGSWRRYANEQLRTRYADVFDRLNALVVLQAPSFDAIRRWRYEQERKLASELPNGAAHLMSEKDIGRFVAFFERLTASNLTQLPDVADVLFVLDESHQVAAGRYRRR